MCKTKLNLSTHFIKCPEKEIIMKTVYSKECCYMILIGKKMLITAVALL